MPAPDLEEPFFETDGVKLQRWLPWLHLFQAFRLSTGIRQILLGCLALLMLNSGQRLISQLPFAPDWTSRLMQESSPVLGKPQFAELAVHWDEILARPLETLAEAFRHGHQVAAPLWSLVPAGQRLFQAGASWSDWATSGLWLLWTLIVWSVCGVAIARFATADFASHRPSGLAGELRFGLTRLSASVGAILLPLLGVACLAAVCLLLGGVGRLPVLGHPALAVLWWLALLCGLGMALIVLLLAVGWPLMVSSVAVEDTEGFDGFSRVYSYLTSRPWYALWLGVLTLLYGSALLVVVATVSVAAHALAESAICATLGAERLLEVTQGSRDGEQSFSPVAVQFWQNAWNLLLNGFLVSYFWTAMTIVYLLLRKSVDATPLDQFVVNAYRSKDDDSLPLVGLAAASQREGPNRDEPTDTE